MTCAMERALAAVICISIPAAVVGVMMTESGHTYGWWVCGGAVLLQLAAMIVIKVVSR